VPNGPWTLCRYGSYVSIGADSVAERTRSADCGGGGDGDKEKREVKKNK